MAPLKRWDKVAIAMVAMLLAYIFLAVSCSIKSQATQEEVVCVNGIAFVFKDKNERIQPLKFKEKLCNKSSNP